MMGKEMMNGRDEEGGRDGWELDKGLVGCPRRALANAVTKATALPPSDKSKACRLPRYSSWVGSGGRVATG
jgi:hypothetical protein